MTTFVELAKDGACMAGDRRVHHTERSKWQHTFRRLVADAARCLKELPGHQAYLDFAVEVGAQLPDRAREIAAERARTARYAGTT